MEPNHHPSSHKVEHPQGNINYLPWPSDWSPSATDDLVSYWSITRLVYYGVFWPSSSQWCPFMAPQLYTAARQISVSQYFWPTEPDKASVFPAVAASGLNLEKRQLYQHGRAEPPYLRGALYRGWSADWRRQGDVAKEGFKILAFAVTKPWQTLWMMLQSPWKIPGKTTVWQILSISTGIRWCRFTGISGTLYLTI